MKDINGKDIKLGQKIKRIEDEGSKFVGRVYNVVMYDFNDDKNPVLCAQALGSTELLYPERAKRFMIVE